MKDSKHIFYFFIKIALFCLLIYVFYLQLNYKNVSLNDFIDIFKKLSFSNLKYFLLAILFVPVNWLLESYKWKNLIQLIQTTYDMKNSVKSVLMGVFLGFITPNRIGEFGGRLYDIQKGLKIQALTLAFVGGVAQFVVTISIGSYFAFRYFSFKYFPLLNDYQILIPILITCLFWVYFNLKKISKFLLSMSCFRKFSDKFIFKFDLKFSFSLKIIFLTTLRYCVYLIQYVLMFYFFETSLYFPFIIEIIATMLLLQTIIPSFALVDIGIRGNILLFLTQEYTESQLVMLVIVMLVWILNLVIPAVIGYLFLFNLKTEVHYEKLTDNNIDKH